MEYPFCDMTVTVYRAGDRQVLTGCYLEISQGRQPADERLQKDFLLVVPGSEQRVFPGDRLVPGIGPEVWDPQLPEGLTVSTVRRFFLDGRLSHIEAK